MKQPISLYIHIPFCQRKCHYCDFNTYAGLDHLIAPYLSALMREMTGWSPLLADYEIETIFFGGGTPSLLSGQQVTELLEHCSRCFSLSGDAEISLEANPGTVDQERLAAYRAAGINRLSFGAQSFDSEELHWLGRIHSKQEIGQAVQMARTAGFRRLNLDLIYGLPGQTLDRWRQSVQRALELEPDHLSLYALTVEEGTPLGNWVATGKVQEPDPDMAADQYLAAAELLANAGFSQYEISNWARPGQACRHNLTYWRNMPYVGLGAGAHSCFGGFRFCNILLPSHYVQRLNAQEHETPEGLMQAIQQASPVAEIDAVDPATDLSDTLILGLRLNEGVNLKRVAERHGIDVGRRYAATIQELSRDGLLEADNHSIRLTPRGRLLSNEVFVRFLPSAATEQAAVSASPRH